MRSRLTGEEVRVIRTALGATPEDLAAAIGVNYHYINAIERGAKPVTRRIDGDMRAFAGNDEKVLDLFLAAYHRLRVSRMKGGVAG